MDEAAKSHPQRVKGSASAATAHSHLTPPIPVYSKVVKKNKRGGPSPISDGQGVAKREPHRDKHRENSSRNIVEDVDVDDKMEDLSETSYNSDEHDQEIQTSEEETTGHAASSPLSSHCRPPSGPHMKRGVNHSTSAPKRRHPVSSGSPHFLQSLAGLPVYNLQQQPQASGDHSYLLSRTSPDGNIEYFTATPISTPTSVNAQFLSSPVLQHQVGVAPPITPSFLFPPQTSSSDKAVSSMTTTRSSEPPAKQPSTIEGVASELETAKVERNKLKAELMSLKQQYQSVKDNAGKHANQLIHQTNTIKCLFKVRVPWHSWLLAFIVTVLHPNRSFVSSFTHRYESFGTGT